MTTLTQRSQVITLVSDPVGREDPFQKVGNGWPADVLMGLAHLHQKRDIRSGVLACEGRCRGTVTFDQWDTGQTVVVPARHQSRDLGAAVVAGVLEVAQQDAPRSCRLRRG